VLDQLRPDKLRADLGPVTIGREIVVLAKTVSTNDIVRKMAARDTPEGLVVFAEHQTAGRGQHGKKWESAAGKGLWFSILLRPNLAAKESPRLTLWAAQTIASTLGAAYSIPAKVKPPNDVGVNGRKLAGVLLEMRAQPQAQHIAVLGIGLNVNQDLADFPGEVREHATSLSIIKGARQDRHSLAVALLRNLDRTYSAAIARS
jgi:BirA family biotin operon repressor/biotin-[acetyl-CoA-carboxylase] ligase